MKEVEWYRKPIGSGRQVRKNRVDSEVGRWGWVKEKSRVEEGMVWRWSGEGMGRRDVAEGLGLER